MHREPKGSVSWLEKADELHIGLGRVFEISRRGRLNFVKSAFGRYQPMALLRRHGRSTILIDGIVRFPGSHRTRRDQFAVTDWLTKDGRTIQLKAIVEKI